MEYTGSVLEHVNSVVDFGTSASGISESSASDI
jgi:hypothetical protein